MALLTATLDAIQAADVPAAQRRRLQSQAVALAMTPRPAPASPQLCQELLERALVAVRDAAAWDEKPGISRAKRWLKDQQQPKLVARLAKLSKCRNASAHLDVSIVDDILAVSRGASVGAAFDEPAEEPPHELAQQPSTFEETAADKAAKEGQSTKEKAAADQAAANSAASVPVGADLGEVAPPVHAADDEVHKAFVASSNLSDEEKNIIAVAMGWAPVAVGVPQSTGPRTTGYSVSAPGWRSSGWASSSSSWSWGRGKRRR